MSRSEAAALIKLAESIADGSAIDWDAAEASASGDDKQVIRQLKVLSNLALLHRTAPLESAGGPGGSFVRRESISPAIGNWAHLTLLERLGGGTFADVYRAWDRHLEREVALKLLRVDASGDDLSSSRIANEGRLLARVSHPNVICVHGVDAHDNRVGLWMELVRGKTLEQQLAAHGPFSAREAAAIGIDLCRALAAIHAAGLIHRDIKAQNVMREDGGRIVLMDLGTGREADRIVARGVPELAGTPLYLAPEIFIGSPASPRTDLYSLGVLLYHLVTGSFPVRAATFNELQKAHANGEVARLRDARADLPTPFVRVVDRAIAPEPAKRYQSAGELESDLADAVGHAPRHDAAGDRAGRLRRLKGWPAVALTLAAAAIVVAVAMRAVPMLRPAPATVRSIAVLPLVNLSGDPAQEYFADGMTDELIGTLGRAPGLNVISRTSSMHFKGSTQTIPDIARALHVDAVLEGSIRIVDDEPRGGGKRVRVNARLIQAGSDTQLWDRTFDAMASNVFALNEQVVRAIGEAIHARLDAAQPPRAAQDFDAFDLYLRGRYYWNARTEEGLKRSLQYFQEAIDRRSDFALAHAGLADAYSLLGYYGFVPAPESRARATAAAMRALELDPSLAEAHGSLAVVQQYEYKWEEADRHYLRALELKPAYATAHQWYGYELAQRGRVSEGLAEMRKAVDLDPLSVPVNGGLGAALIYARQYDEAIAQLTRTAAMDPSFARTHTELAKAYLFKGDRRKALEEARRAAAIGVRDVLVRAQVGYVEAVAGSRGDAQRVLRDILDRYARGETAAAMGAALVYTGLGQRDEALRWLEEARKISDPEVSGIRMDPQFDNLHADPRFANLLAAIGMAQ